METLDPDKLRELYRRAEANDLGLSLAAFSDALMAVGQRYLTAGSTLRETISFYEKLHLKDFALAQACALGGSVAWTRFLEQFSSRMYAAAMGVAKNEQIARDLRDSLAGDLFVGRSDGIEGIASKMASYSGRGSLEGWLYALLAHDYVDRYRSQRRIVSLDSRVEIIKGFYVIQEEAQKETDPRLGAAIEAAFLERPAEERFLLATYFFDGWTLAKIAKAIGIDESSVSRRMNGILSKLRKGIRQRLQKDGMSTAQIQESFSKEGRTGSVDIRELVFRGLARE